MLPKRVATHSVNEVFSPIAQVVQNVPSCSLESIAHSLEAIKGYFGCAYTAHVVATVVFEHVDAPSREAFGIILLVVQRSRFDGSESVPRDMVVAYSQNLAQVISPALLYMPYLRFWL